MTCPTCGHDHGDTTACPPYGGSGLESGGWEALFSPAQEERIRQIIREEFRRAGDDPFKITFTP
jgi:hypothetical protein